MVQNQEINSALVLSNATQLGVEVLMRVAKEDISGAIGGEPINRAAAAGLIGSAIEAQVSLQRKSL